jgi:anti-sigma B factor antagonist
MAFGSTTREVDFDLTTQALGDGTFVVALSGEIDLYTAPELKAELLRLVAEEPRRIVVDMTDATFVDSTTLGVLLGAVKRLRLQGGELEIVCSDLNIRRILSITLLDRAFTIYESLDEALRAQPLGEVASPLLAEAKQSSPEQPQGLA